MYIFTSKPLTKAALALSIHVTSELQHPPEHVRYKTAVKCTTSSNTFIVTNMSECPVQHLGEETKHEAQCLFLANPRRGIDEVERFLQCQSIPSIVTRENKC